MSRTRHVGAGVPLNRLPRFDTPAAAHAPTRAVLNVIRVALDRADMNHRATGFKTYEVDAAKEWVAIALDRATRGADTTGEGS